MNVVARGFGLGLACLVTLLTGCTGQRLLMPTPNVYLEARQDTFGALDPALKTTEVPLFFVTDRLPERDEAGNLRYGYGRSGSVAFGRAVVELGRDATWEELLEASRTQQRVKPFALEITEVEELVRPVPTPLPYTQVDGQIVRRPDLAAQLAEDREAFRRILVSQLALTPRKEVFIFVHGYHNSFDDAAFAMAELWHFLGRIGVPLVYTWPAGYPGLFGYTYDRESSEYTVYHLRQVLELLAGLPEVEKIHLIAHSRGTDVALNAVRESMIEARALGDDPRERLKIHNLILAAPDLDLQVAAQRVVGDHLSVGVHRFTLYTSPKDKAIGIAARLFASPRGRLGTLGIEELPDAVGALLDYSESNLAIVNFQGASDARVSGGDRYGHSYFRNAPTVSSDVVLMLRDDLDPGPPGRPLESLGHRFWRVPPGYPAKQPRVAPAAVAAAKDLFFH
jgi:esterase/lipase superfamily enzyme